MIWGEGDVTCDADDDPDEVILGGRRCLGM